MTNQAPDRVTLRVLRVGDRPDAPVVARTEVAATYWTRLRGMLARRELPESLLFVPGGSVHGVGMTVSLDVAMLAPLDDGADRVGGPFRVVKVAVLRPFGLVGSKRGVKTVLEAAEGSFARWGVVEGAVVRFDPPAQP